MLLLEYAFNSLDLVSLASRVPAHSEAAISHLKKCGYDEVGRLPDWLRLRSGERCDEVVFVISQEKWRSRHKARA
jgi:RimJ/RimL family protein N-acetyltransferase